MNQTQAVERVKEHIESAAAEFPGEIELSPVEDPAFPTCEGEPGEDGHTVTVRHAYWVDGEPEEKNEELAESIHAYWSSGNWRVTADERPEKLHIEAKNQEDHFRMNLVVSKDGRPSLAAYSPCVQADEGE